MASSNKHWPSMYRSSLACNIQPDMNSAGAKSSLMSSRLEESGSRSQDPRPRWNPRPEQIRILEGIFNSGMVNPPRDEIRRIRLQLQEYGPVGDANVFYWFQNRKSRTKHKLRAAAGHLQPSARATLARACASSPAAAHAPVTPLRHLQLAIAGAPVAPTSSSSSSSSDRSSGSSKSVKPPGGAPLASSPAAATAIQLMNVLPATTPMDFLTPTPAPATALDARQLYYHNQFVAPPPLPDLISSPESSLLLQWQQGRYLPATELGGVLACGHPHAPAMQQPAAAISPSVLLGLCNDALGQDYIDTSCSSKGLAGGGHGHYYWNNTCGGSSDLMSNKTDAVSSVIRDDEKARLGLLHYDFGVTTTTTATAVAISSAPPSLAAPVHAAVDASTAMLPSSAPSNAAATSAVLTDQLQGLLDAGLIGGTPPPTATVVVAVVRDAVLCTSTAQFSVPAMRLNVRQFGEAALLLRHSGEHVLVDESGVTVEPLQQDALYYVLINGN